ncbi:MAG: thioredoxin [Candidatus Moraniibacteriota bacterium]
MAVEFTDANFETEVLKSDRPVLVDFWAPWCGPCQIMGPIIEELAKEVPMVKIGKLNVDDNPLSAQNYGVMSIPTMKLFKDGQVLKEFIGVQSKDTVKSELSNI